MSQPNTTSTNPLYKSHPLYFFRRLILINALIGIPLTAISAASAPQYTMGIWIFGCLALIASGLLALVDLLVWAHRKHKEDLARWERGRGVCRACAGPVEGGEDSDGNGVGVNVADAGRSPQTLTDNMVTRHDDGNGNNDEDDDGPKWPVRWIMILDFLLTGVLFWMLMYEMAVANDPWYDRYSSGSSLVRCYATVPMGCSVVLHARCWWRQFRAREREAWGRELGLRMSVGGVGRMGDVEAGVERIVCSYGHGLDPGYEGHYICGSRSANRPLHVVQRENGLVGSMKETVRGLNREAMQALKSKSWLPDRSTSGERQSLLAANRCAHAGHTQHTNDNNERCACSHPHTCRSVRPGSSPIAHLHVHGGHNGNNDMSGKSNNVQEVKPIAIDRTAAYLTPSDSGITSASSSTVSSSSGSHESCVNKSKKDAGDATDIKDEEVAATSTLLSHVGDNLGVVGRNGGKDNDDDDDADIMVVKKAEKGKAKGQKQKKGKSREVEFED